MHTQNTIYNKRRNYETVEKKTWPVNDMQYNEIIKSQVMQLMNSYIYIYNSSICLHRTTAAAKNKAITCKTGVEVLWFNIYTWMITAAVSHKSSRPYVADVALWAMLRLWDEADDWHNAMSATNIDGLCVYHSHRHWIRRKHVSAL